MSLTSIKYLLWAPALLLIAGCAAVPSASSAAGAASSAMGGAGSAASGAASGATDATGAASPTGASTPGTTVNVSNPPPPCCPKQTLPQFLGITGLIAAGHACCNNLRNQLGAIFPGLESVPAMLAIADPANANSSNPEVAAASTTKQEQDKAGQKIKAIDYLATVGCLACYPDVEVALVDSLDDCTEAVRYAAAKALKDLAAHNCSCCGGKSCCSAKTRKKLWSIGNEHARNGCWKESSQRVRRMARLAADGCCNCDDDQKAGPTEGPAPSEGGAIAGAEGEGANKAGGEKNHAAEGPEGEAGGDKAGEIMEKAPEMLEMLKGEKLPLPGQQRAAGAQTPAMQVVTRTIPAASAAGAEDCNCRPRGGVTVTTISPKPGTNAAQQATTTNAAAPANAMSAFDVTKVAGDVAQAKQASAMASTAAVGDSAAKPDARPAARSSMNLPTVLAEVNGEAILSSEVEPAVDAALTVHKGASGMTGERLAALRRTLTAQEIDKAVDRKLVCQAARSQEMAVVSTMFTNPSQSRPANLAPADEQVRAAQWLQTALPVNTNVTRPEMEVYYRGHADQFLQPGMVRCETLFAPRGDFRTAEQAIATLEYLKTRAAGYVSSAKNVTPSLVRHKNYDWLRPKDAPPGPVADAMFTLPIGVSSGVLADDEGWHVVRVLERRVGAPRPLEMVSDQVRASIVAERRKQQELAYVAQLRRGAHIRTSFDRRTP